MRRRDFIRTVGGGAAASAAAAGATGTAAAQPSFGGWLSGVTNYSEVADRTGQDSVTVEVGVEANGGAFGFGPAAVQVDPGTEVTWEWTGEGGGHNVAAQEGGDFESQVTSEAGFTFSQTLDSEGVVKYFCQPHKSLGMKGVVVVGSIPDSGGGGGEGGGGPSVPQSAMTLGVATTVMMIATLSLAFFFIKYGGDYTTPDD